MTPLYVVTTTVAYETCDTYLGTHTTIEKAIEACTAEGAWGDRCVWLVTPDDPDADVRVWPRDERESP